MQQRTGSFKEEFSKNTFYRFLNSSKTNWLRFTSLLAADIVNHDIRDLTDQGRKNVFIIDDSLFNHTSCKKWDQKFLTTRICISKRGFGCRRKFVRTKAPEAMMALLDTALSAGLNADYVLFDSWFSNPAQVTAIHSKGMDVIAMVKKSSRIRYSYGGEQLNIKEIYSRNKKCRGRSKYLLSVDVMADITFGRSLCILMDALMASTADFEARLPEYLQNALHPEIAAA